MRRNAFRALVVLFPALAFTAWPAASQARATPGAIDAVITDTALAPISGATVTILGTSVRATTGDNGRLRITSLPEGRHHLSINRIGFRAVFATVDIASGDTARLSF